MKGEIPISDLREAKIWPVFIISSTKAFHLKRWRAETSLSSYALIKKKIMLLQHKIKISKYLELAFKTPREKVDS